MAIRKCRVRRRKRRGPEDPIGIINKTFFPKTYSFDPNRQWVRPRREKECVPPPSRLTTAPLPERLAQAWQFITDELAAARAFPGPPRSASSWVILTDLTAGTC